MTTYGFTRKGIRELLSRHVDLSDMYHEPRGASHVAIRDIYSHLIRQGECDKTLLQGYHRPLPHPNHEIGRYGEKEAKHWFEDIAKPALHKLSGITFEGSIIRFDGIPNEEAGKYNENHLIALSEIRDAPEIEVEAVLDARGVPVNSDRRDAILSVFECIRREKSITSDLLHDHLRKSPIHLEDIQEDLRAIPVVSKQVTEPRSPNDIRIETYQDVIDAEDELGAGMTVSWTFTPDESREKPIDEPAHNEEHEDEPSLTYGTIG